MWLAGWYGRGHLKYSSPQEHNEGTGPFSCASLFGFLTNDQRLFTSKEQSNKTDDDHLHLVSKRRVDVLVRLVLTITTVGLLVGPSAVLFLVTGHDTFKIVLIMGFTLLFSAALSVATKAKRHEMLAATAT